MGVGKLHSVCDQQTLAIQRCQRGRPEAFEWIVNRYMKQAYSIALGLVGNRDDALELSQEAFYRALRNIDKLKSHSKFFPWFYQILKNLCFTHLRKRVSRSTGNLEETGYLPAETAGVAWFDPEAVAEANETKQKVWEAIGRLKEKHREVIILRHFQNMSYDDISENLFCSKGTVMSRLYHARKKLKVMLDDQKGGRHI
jgi:RNA polymerase sigma-70 factor (ECF subfamily)